MAASGSLMPPTFPIIPASQNFQNQLEDAKFSKMYMNRLVMDYLVKSGYQSAAQKFAKEANIQPKSGIDSITERVNIRNDIYSGDIQSAIEKINELNPQILDNNEFLHFSLLRLQLIELIRTCTANNDDITPALDFATTHLAPRAPTNSKFLGDLEQTLCLLIFPSDKLSPELSSMLDPKLRKEIAHEVNDAILNNQGLTSETTLCNLVKLRTWAEQQARDTKKDIPEKLNIGLDDQKNSTTAIAQGGNADTVMQELATTDPMVS